jgi:hypothetical protein
VPFFQFLESKRCRSTGTAIVQVLGRRDSRVSFVIILIRDDMLIYLPELKVDIPFDVWRLYTRRFPNLIHSPVIRNL